MKVGDLVSYTDIFGDKHVGVLTAGYEELTARHGLKTYDHQNLVEVYFSHGYDVLFKEQLEYEDIPQ